MKKALIIIIVIAISAFCYLFRPWYFSSGKGLKEGDLLFHISESSQAPLIMWGTLSLFSHCGIVVEKEGGLYVLEAENGVELTPLDKWKERGRYRWMWSRRIYKEPVKIEYQQYLGQRYDWQFKFDNGKMYCSELIYVIYRDQFGKEIGRPRRIGSWLGVRLGVGKKTMDKRGIDPEQLAIAPIDCI